MERNQLNRMSWKQKLIIMMINKSVTSLNMAIRIIWKLAQLMKLEKILLWRGNHNSFFTFYFNVKRMVQNIFHSSPPCHNPRQTASQASSLLP